MTQTIRIGDTMAQIRREAPLDATSDAPTDQLAQEAVDRRQRELQELERARRALARAASRGGRQRNRESRHVG